MDKALQPLSVAGVKEAIEADAVLVDSRLATVFTIGYVPGSISLGLEGSFEEWANALLPLNKPLVLITEEGKAEETASRLAAEGFTNIAGYLKGGFAAWQKSGETIDLIIDIEADEMAMDLPFDENIVVMDVRRPAEYAEGHVVDAINVPLSEFSDLVNIANIEEEQNVYLHCRTGYRSTIAASLLKRQGIHNIRNVLGGWEAIRKESRIKTEKEKAPKENKTEDETEG
jgi:rhodanese-related sulfurtransferase